MQIISPTLSLIINRTLPLVVGVFAIMLVQLVDTVFIGQLGLDELTVQGVTLPFATAVIGVQVGLGVAATCIISRAAGAKKTEEASVTATISAVFGTLLIASIALILWVLRESVFMLFISGAESAEHIQELLSIFNLYWPVWLFSVTCGASMYFISAVYRANEDTKTPGFILVAASVINLILDPILIFTLDMGIVGAAVASATAFLSTITYLLVKSRSKNWFASFQFNAQHRKYFYDLIKMTVPTTANQILPSVSAFLSMIFISAIGTEAIAFWSLLTRMETFMLVLTLAMTMSLPPIVGRYLGEGRSEKIADVLTTAAMFLIAFHLLIALIMAFGSGYLVPVISKEDGLREWMSFALHIIPFSYGPLGLCMVVVSAFNALGLPKRALLVSFTRLFVFYIPAIWIGTRTGNIPDAIVAATIANIAAGANAWFMLRKHLNLTSPFSKREEREVKGSNMRSAAN